MRASRETARAARSQLRQATDLVAPINHETDIVVLRESMLKLILDVTKFVDAAERVLPANHDYEQKAAKKNRQPLPAA